MTRTIYESGARMLSYEFLQEQAREVQRRGRLTQPNYSMHWFGHSRMQHSADVRLRAKNLVRRLAVR